MERAKGAEVQTKEEQWFFEKGWVVGGEGRGNTKHVEEKTFSNQKSKAETVKNGCVELEL